MRISIRRCLSMLRNTVYGNELAVPATNACQGCNMLTSCACVGVLVTTTLVAALAARVRLDLPDFVVSMLSRNC